MAIVKKILMMIMTMLIVSFFVFLSFEFISGDIATSILGINATDSAIEQLRQELGLNRPFIIRYFDWLFCFIKGDMGFSYSYNLEVSELIFSKLPINIVLTLISFIFVVLIAIPISIIAASKKNSILDRIICLISQIIMATPAFFAGILITFIFGLILNWFMPGAYISYENDFWGFVSYLIFPAFAIALPKIAMVVSLLRISILGEIGKDYVRTAYSKGNNEIAVMLKHVLKNAMLPIVTFLGMSIADIMVGSVVIEQIFLIPGIGNILLNAISNRDYSLIMAIIVWMAFFIVFMNMLVDASYSLLDPRIRTYLKKGAKS